MTMPEPATRLAPMISDLGGRFMMDPVGFGRAGEMNIEPGMGVYVAGRFGVLGRVHADVVIASAVFIEPSFLSEAWNKVLETADPVRSAEVYASIAAEYGRTHIAEAPNLERWIELSERVVDSASPVGTPLFAGWRVLPRPTDPAGRAYLLLHVLRELRFGLHANAVVASGFPPLKAVLCSSGGERAAAMLQWQAPYPELSDADRSTRLEIEDTTDKLSEASMKALNEPELEEFVTLTTGIAESAV